MSTRSHWRLSAAVVAMALIAGCGSSSEPSAETTDPEVSSATTFADAEPSPGCEDPNETFARLGENGRFESGGQDRLFSIAVPSDADDDTPLPLVVNMHGALGNPKQQEQSSEFGAVSREQGFVVLSPQALGQRPVWSLAENGPDLVFVEDLVTEVESKVCIDSSRIYLTGFSMGGMMSMTLACRDPERYAAIAPVAGAIEVPDCERAAPVPLVTMHGTADNSVRIDGSFDPNVGLLVGTSEGPPREEVVSEWASANGCDLPAQEARIEPDVEHLTFSCDDNESVEMYVIDNGGHTWPGSTPNPISQALAGETTQTIDATQLIWDFFRAHQRPQSAEGA